jgi:hypothetical protein
MNFWQVGCEVVVWTEVAKAGSDWLRFFFTVMNLRCDNMQVIYRPAEYKSTSQKSHNHRLSYLVGLFAS